MVVFKPVTREQDARVIASNAAALWQRIDTILSPVLGRRGVAALYERSITAISAEYPVFEQVSFEHVPTDFTFIEQVLTQLEPARAIAVHTVLVHTFHNLLTELIGTPLAEQILGMDSDYLDLLKGNSHVRG